MDKIKYYLLIRHVQISLAFALAVWISFIFNFEYSYWIPMTVMIMFGPFEEGTVAVRVKERMIGTLIGIILGIFFVYLMEFSSLIYYGLPLVAFIIAYFAITNYVIASTFITIMVIFIFAVVHPNTVTTLHFGLDRAVDTLIAALICILFEVLFKSAHLTRHTINISIETSVKAYKSHLAHLLESLALKRAVSFYYVNEFNQSVMQLQKQINLLKYRFYKKNINDKKLNLIKDILQSIRSELMVIHYLVEYQGNHLETLIFENKALFNEMIKCLKEDASNISNLVNQMIYNNKIKDHVYLVETIKKLDHLFIQARNC